MKDDALYLLHIRECIERIEGYVAGGRLAFLEQTIVQDAVLRNLQILVESTQRLAPKTRTEQPDIDWRGI